METIKANTKKGQYYYERYNRSTDFELFHCYNRPSTNKTRADYFCRDRMRKENGHGYKILSYNCHFFVVAWRTEDGHGLRVETAYKSILITE